VDPCLSHRREFDGDGHIIGSAGRESTFGGLREQLVECGRSDNALIVNEAELREAWCRWDVADPPGSIDANVIEAQEWTIEISLHLCRVVRIEPEATEIAVKERERNRDDLHRIGPAPVATVEAPWARPSVLPEAPCDEQPALAAFSLADDKPAIVAETPDRSLDGDTRSVLALRSAPAGKIGA